MSYIKMAAGLGVVAMIYALYWGIDNSGYTRGRDEVQIAWDADKKIRKDESERQVAVTEQTNKEHTHEFNKTKSDLSSTRARLDAALERLRNTPVVSGQGDMPMAGSGQAPMPCMAGNPGGVGSGISKRIGSCETTGADPCTTDRLFFESALRDALDRKATREWATGQGIKVE